MLRRLSLREFVIVPALVKVVVVAGAADARVKGNSTMPRSVAPSVRCRRALVSAPPVPLAVKVNVRVADPPPAASTP